MVGLGLARQRVCVDRMHVRGKHDGCAENCKRNDISAIEVIGDSLTKLTFEVPPLFESGDTIVLGDNIQCDATSYQCTDEKLLELKGEYKFADWDGTVLHGKLKFRI